MSDTESDKNSEELPFPEAIIHVDVQNKSSTYSTEKLDDDLKDCLKNQDNLEEFTKEIISKIDETYWDEKEDIDVLREIRGCSPLKMAAQLGNELLYAKVVNVGIVKYVQNCRRTKLESLFKCIRDYKKSVRIETDGLCLALTSLRDLEKFLDFGKIIQIFLENCSKPDDDVLKFNVNSPMTLKYNGNTPLHYALKSGVDCCAVELLRMGARIDIPNKFGIRPIDAFREESMKKYLDSLVIFDTSDFNSKIVYLDCKSIDNNFINYLVDNKHFNGLILHPVVASIIHLKWSRLRNIRLLGILWKIIYLFALVISVQNYNREWVYGSASVAILFIIISSIWDENCKIDKAFLIAFISTLFLTGTIFLFKSIYGLICILLLPILFMLGNCFDMLKVLIPVCYVACEISLILEHNVQYGTFVCLVLAGFDTFNILFHYPSCATHAEIFKIVAKECCNFLIFLLPLLGFFALGVQVISDKEIDYQIASGKVLDLLFINSFESDNLLRICLLLLVGVIGRNIMTGLAIYDINDIKGNAETLVCLKRTERILKIEKNLVLKTLFKSILDANHEHDKISLVEGETLKFEWVIVNRSNAFSGHFQKIFEPIQLSETSLKMISNIVQERSMGRLSHNFTGFVLKVEPSAEPAEIV